MTTNSSTLRYAAPAALAVLLAGLWLWRDDGRTIPSSPAPETGGALDASGVQDRIAGPPGTAIQGNALGASISGTILDPGGQPIAGAQVCAYAWTSRLTGREAWRPHCTTSERDGHYRIEGLAPVRQRVTASAAGHIPGIYARGDGAVRVDAVDLRPAMEAQAIDIVLEDGGVELKGIVRDLSGGPVEGAQVVTERAFARSDAEGIFSLWVRPGLQSVVADAEGYAPSNEEGNVPGHTFELFLTPEAVLVGKVVRAGSGEPVADAMVKAGAQDWGSNHSAFTDAGGNFRIANLEPGVYKPSAEADDARGGAVEQVLLGMGETSAPIVIEAHPAFFVEGRVVASGGASCGEGWVALRDAAAGRAANASVEGDGSVRLPGMLPGTYSVNLGCVGHVAESSYEPVVIVDKSLSGLTWKVSRGQAIRGQVVDTGGKPVAGLEVQARQQIDPSQPHARQTWARATTSGDGRFDLGGLLAGRFHVTVAGGRATPTEPLSVTLAERQDVDDLRIELPASGAVRGTVVDERGRAIPRTTVSLSGGPQDFVTMVADDGSFTFEYVGAGAYQAVAAGRWGELRRPDSDRPGESVTVEPGKTATVKLVVEAAAGTISGTVRDADGGIVPDAFVEALRESEDDSGPAMRDAPWGNFFETPSLTEIDGRFTLKGLPAGKFTVRAYRKGGGEGFVEHVAPGADVVVTIAATGRLAGVVRLPDGAAPEEFALRVVDTTTGFTRRDNFYRTGGAWSVPELPAGQYRIRVDMGTATAESQAFVRAGEDTTDVRIELTPKVSVRGSVVDSTGAPIVGLQVFARALGGGAFSTQDNARRHVTDTAGTFELANVPTGEVEFVLIPQNAGAGSGAKIPMKLSSTASTIELAPITMPGTNP
jgi:protocatechuate 3,4-dioxygenase beta subunit